MATKNGVPYRTWLVPSSKYGIKCPYAMNPKKITYHNTDNEMPAQNEVSYLRNNNNQTSYHVAIDEEEAVQALPFNRNGWHAGDGGNGYGNRNTVGIEICRNYDRSRRITRLIDPLRGMYDKAEQNAIKVGAALHKELGIPATLNNIKKHQDWSGKWCPSKILNEARWSAFQVAVIAEYNRLMGQGSKLVSTDVHVVKKGDTLSSIAKKHGTTVGALVKENGIKNPNVISIGQKITIPKTVAKAVAASKPVSKPKPKAPSTVSGAKLVKREDAYFLATKNIKVRNAPSTSAKHTGTLPKGASIHYYAVYEGNGYRWLQYVGNTGNTLYLPYRPLSDKNPQWGTFHSKRP